MPLQDYWCKDCRKMYEIIVPMAEEKKKIECPKCNKVLKKQISFQKVIKIH